MEFAKQLRQLFELRPEGTHFCLSENKPGFALDAELMLKFLDHHDQLQAQCEALAEALERLTKAGPPSRSCSGAEVMAVLLEDNCNIAKEALETYRASQKEE